jgi:pimeloyl-ACP methyl ester carboxylesterase
MSPGVARLASRAEHVEVRGLRYRVRHWGSSDAPVVLMVHGWMDVGASFQFLVDALERDWHVIAPDWRGFGETQWAPQGYWFADYLADLDALVERYSPRSPVRLVGHSLGGNVAMLYSGLRPQRVSRVVSLEGFGIPESRVAEIVARYRGWLDGLREAPTFQTYESLDQVARRLQKNARHLTIERARFLAAHWAKEGADGIWRLVSDPAHKLPFPTVYRLDEALAVWRCIEAPVRWVVGTQSRVHDWLLDGELDRRRQALARCTVETLADAGHMLHLEQPEALARLIEPFLAGRDSASASAAR